MPRPLDAALSGVETNVAAQHLSATLNGRYAEASAQTILRDVIVDEVAGPVALVSSFGAESAVLLHMAAQIDRAVPVIFIDTGRLFKETLAYRDELIDVLGLTDVRTAAPESLVEKAKDPFGALFAIDPDACCDFRKVAPLAEALKPFSAWITGRKRFQASTRAAIPLFETDATHLKVNPLATLLPEAIAAYLDAHDLPRHPLVAKGFPSIGCEPCTSRVEAGEDARAGRWRGAAKTECGLHVRPATRSA